MLSFGTLDFIILAEAVETPVGGTKVTVVTVQIRGANSITLTGLGVAFLADGTLDVVISTETVEADVGGAKVIICTIRMSEARIARTAASLTVTGLIVHAREFLLTALFAAIDISITALTLETDPSLGIAVLAFRTFDGVKVALAIDTAVNRAKVFISAIAVLGTQTKTAFALAITTIAGTDS